MAIYELIVGDEMGNETWLLEHDDKTPEKFKADCHKAIREVGEDVIANVRSPISVSDWLEATMPVLVSWDYKLIKPYSVGFYSEQLNCIDEDSEWREVVADELYRKAVKANFDYWTKRYTGRDYFISSGDEEFHHGDCPVFQKLWDKQFHNLGRELFTVDNMELWQCSPCTTCFSEAEVCAVSEQQSQSDVV